MGNDCHYCKSPKRDLKTDGYGSRGLSSEAFCYRRRVLFAFIPAEANYADKTFLQEGFQLLVDPKSFLYLDGTEIDFEDGLNGKGFVYNNPDTVGCGCGISFRKK
jgi:iron-sulfur cluster assembly accessory protein